jgi:hypothetical protein
LLKETHGHRIWDEVAGEKIGGLKQVSASVVRPD